MGFHKSAKWITYSCNGMPEFQKKFTLDAKPQTAYINICGLGFFELFINGRKVSEDLLVPALSDYEPRENMNLIYPINDTFTHRVYYLKYEVAEYLTKGTNTLDVILGNGWYKQTERTVEGTLSYGEPKLRFDLCIDGNTHIVSDKSLKCRKSHIIRSNLFYGEIHDFNIKEEFCSTPEEATAPQGKLCLQECPPDRHIRTIYPRVIKQEKDVTVYDCGENITGYAVMESDCDVQTRYAEEIYKDKSLDFTSAGGKEQIQGDSFISDGKINTLIPRFVWHGFRYFEVKGSHRNICVHVVHTAVKVIADFKCNVDIINRIFENYKRTILGNMHCGVPSDCPTRERLGYTGDGQLLADSAMLIFDSEKFYEKWIRDIADCQDIHNGHIQHTAPFMGGGGGPGGWGCAIVTVPYFHYRHYRNKKIIEEYFPYMEKWCSYMDSRCENGIVVREEAGGWCLGEWGIWNDIQLPEPFVNTYFYIKSLMYMSEMAKVISKPYEDIDRRIETLKLALENEYADHTVIVAGTQGAHAFLWDIGMGDYAEKVNIRYLKAGAYDTGIFGTDILFRLLFEEGYQDTAAILYMSQKEGTVGNMIKNGATTIWEYPGGESSHNHPMFGAFVKYLFTGLMGIEDGEVYRLSPKPSKHIQHAEASHRGMTISYDISDNTVTFKISGDKDAVFVCNGEEIFIEKNSEFIKSYDFQ